MRRILLELVACALLTGLLTGCGGTKNTSRKAAGPPRLRFGLSRRP
jgi:hypothetical protein